jgi:hypothetical protein
VVLFLIFCSSVVLPYAGVSQEQFLKAVFPFEKDSAALGNTLAVVLLTILLYCMNLPLIRLYEGYPWLVVVRYGRAIRGILYAKERKVGFWPTGLVWPGDAAPSKMIGQFDNPQFRF